MASNKTSPTGSISSKDVAKSILDLTGSSGIGSVSGNGIDRSPSDGSALASGDASNEEIAAQTGMNSRSSSFSNGPKKIGRNSNYLTAARESTGYLEIR